MKAHEVIKRPLVTEKVMMALERSNTVAFEVATAATKLDVRKAVEEIWKVKVTQVRTVVVRGKVKRTGAFEGKRRNWKKAYVTLKQGDKIELFAGA